MKLDEGQQPEYVMIKRWDGIGRRNRHWRGIRLNRTSFIKHVNSLMVSAF